METTNGNDPTKLIVDVSSGTIVLLEHNYLDKNYDDVVITLDTTNPQFPFGKKEVLDNE
jgi:hypothetical protein